MKRKVFLNGDEAISFWTFVYMSVTGSYVRLPLDPPAQPSPRKSKIVAKVVETREKAETLA